MVILRRILMWNFIATALFTPGCVGSKRISGKIYYSPGQYNRYEFIYPVNANLPSGLTKVDYSKLERVISQIQGLDDPIRIRGVFAAWVTVRNSILYRTDKHDIYLVRDGEGEWFFSELLLAPW